MILTHKAILELVVAHQNLDGTKENAYKFAPQARYGLAKNLRILRSRTEDINKVRAGLADELSKEMGDKKPDTPEFKALEKEFDERYKQFLDATEEIANLMKIKFVDLNLDQNQIPVTVLAALSPIILEDDVKS